MFSQKKMKLIRPQLFFNDVRVNPVHNNKIVGLTLDSKFTFSNHINAKIAIARNGNDRYCKIYILYSPL